MFTALVNPIMAVLPYLPTGESGSGDTATSIGSALTSAMSTTAGEAMDVIGDILPIALPIMGAVVVIFLGIKIFKRLAK